jgi:hypothetical protein
MIRTAWMFVLLAFGAVLMCKAQEQGQELMFGQVYGSAGYLSLNPAGTMVDAPATVLMFTADDGRRSLTLTTETGDYIALLQPGHYCLKAYTRQGKELELGKSQLRCVDVRNGKDTRLDVMLAPKKK